MKTTAALLFTLAAAVALRAQNFDSGSNGSFGAINVTAGTVTLDLPADGILHCTTINVAPSTALRFNPNPLNTPVHLLATGDVIIAGSVDVSGQAPASLLVGGRAGPGGYTGGAGGATTGGDGLGPGGGRHGSVSAAGGGSFGTVSTFQSANRTHGAAYGNALVLPLVGGSGGGGVDGDINGFGGGGGGALLIASNTKIVVLSGGLILARGGAPNFSIIDGNAGSGGSIRLVAPGVYGVGSARLDPSGAGGGAGRMRVDSLYKVNPNNPAETFALSITPASAITVGSNMLVFPPNNPRLDITAAAGTNIPEGTANPVAILLPSGTSAAQSVTVQARNYGAIVPIRVALIPESGSTTFVDGSIDNTSTTTVNVTLPTNVRIFVQAWTR